MGNHQKEIFLVLSIFLIGFQCVWTQTTQKGIIVEMGSNNKLVAGVGIKVAGASPTDSDQEGRFILNLTASLPGDPSMINDIYKKGFKIVNYEKVASWNISSASELKIILGRTEVISALHKKYYDTGESDSEKEYRKTLAELEELRKQNALSAVEYDQKADSISKSMMERQKRLEIHALKFACINRDELDAMEKQAMKLLDYGDVYGAIRLYEKMKLDSAMTLKITVRQEAKEDMKLLLPSLANSFQLLKQADDKVAYDSVAHLIYEMATDIKLRSVSVEWFFQWNDPSEILDQYSLIVKETQGMQEIKLVENSLQQSLKGTKLREELKKKIQLVFERIEDRKKWINIKEKIQKQMKKIKIFIALSAELNEDKQMFDLYFSDKNRLYRDRNIDFDQHTWMDFSSSLNEGRLQDHYNDYTRECDIVIFLFHTRMGRYTKEELEVAHEIYLKTKAAKPKISVYFREEGIVDESLKDFKSYCEKNLGHFCDLYTNYDDLRLKFDKQLQILENEGFIKPDSVNVKRTLRFVLLYALVPVLVVVLAFFAFYYYSSVTSTVRLTDTSKSSLPFYGTDIALEYADKSEIRHVDRLSDRIVFKEIHTKYLDENARLKIESKGYVTVDTVLNLEKNVILGVSQDSSLAMIFGTVKDEDNRPLADATVQVLDMRTVSDGMGNFQLPIPAEKQKEEQRVTVHKDGYQLWNFTEPVSDRVLWEIILRK